MWRGMLGDFDVDDLLRKPSSVTMYVFFQIVVVVLMMNLIIAIMGGASMLHAHSNVQAARCFLLSNPIMR